MCVCVHFGVLLFLGIDFDTFYIRIVDGILLYVARPQYAMTTEMRVYPRYDRSAAFIQRTLIVFHFWSFQLCCVLLTRSGCCLPPVCYISHTRARGSDRTQSSHWPATTTDISFNFIHLKCNCRSTIHHNIFFILFFFSYVSTLQWMIGMGETTTRERWNQFQSV